MKKPKISTHYDCLVIGSRRKNIHEVAESYSEMIDAFIKAHEDLVEWNDCIPSSNETQDIIEEIEQVLKKAGVQL